MQNIIKVNSISKKYKIGEIHQYFTLRDKIAEFAKLPFFRETSKDKGCFYALKDVSFNVNSGEVIGVIGRNGAGKTTLLKILSRITPPTKGEIEFNGRIGSLLEVGTGFHPELTGRENIFFNGSILGMKKNEIKRKFDEIVEFSGVNDFIDTPIKRYSGGMRLRLAFAVAAHLEPEILLIDEVLAVGDMAFQEKCIGKVGDISKQGRTIFFVSHNMQAVMALCSRTIVIDNGEICFDGETKKAVQEYTKLNSINIDTSSLLKNSKRYAGNGELTFVSFRYKNKQGIYIDNPRLGEECIIELVLFAKQHIRKSVRISIAVSDLFGKRITMFDTKMTGLKFDKVDKGDFVVNCHIPKIPFVPNTYKLGFFAEVNGLVADWILEGKEMIVHDGDFYKSGEVFPKDHIETAVEHCWRV